ncbi:MAG TPA: autotransporter-associated beta strand repeat-containing protein [Chthoniobacterales bacterium]
MIAFFCLSAATAHAICEGPDGLIDPDCGSGGASTNSLWWLPSSSGGWSNDNNWALDSLSSSLSGHPTSPAGNNIGFYLHFGYAAGAANTNSTDDIGSLQILGLDFGSGTNNLTIASGNSLTITPTAGVVPTPSTYIQVASGGSAFIDVQGTLSANLTNGTVGADIGVHGGTFNVNSNMSIGSLAGNSTGTVNLNANLTVGTTNLSTVFSGGIGGNGSLTKVGTGTLELNGNNGYSGTTTVNAGTLRVNSVPGGSATGSGDVTVNSGATIAGTGNVGNLAVNFGGTLAPGNSTGAFSVAGHLDLAGTLAIQLGGTTQGSYDQVVVGFGATLYSPTLSLSLVGGFTPTVGQQFVIIQNNSPIGLGGAIYPITGSFSNGSTVTDDQGNVYSITFLPFPSEVILTDISVVPEPATWLLLTVGAAGSLLGRLRRRR